MSENFERHFPRFHSEFELKNKIEYLKWQVLLSTIGLSASVGLYKYFQVSSDVLTWFYEFGWFCLVISIWIGFQAVYMMSATTVFRFGDQKKKKTGKEIRSALKKPQDKRWLPLLSVFLKAVDIQFGIVVNFFMIGFMALAIGIFYPLVAANPLMSSTMIPAFALVFWLGIPKDVKNLGRKIEFPPRNLGRKIGG